MIKNLDSLPIFVRISYRQEKNKDNNCQNSPIIETFFDRLRRQLYCVQPDNYKYKTTPDRFPKPMKKYTTPTRRAAQRPTLHSHFKGAYIAQEATASRPCTETAHTQLDRCPQQGAQWRIHDQQTSQ